MAAKQKPILYKGMGQPYLALFNFGGMPIMNPITGIPLGAYISTWSYRYDEEKENLATITFDTGNPDTVDIAEIQENQNILTISSESQTENEERDEKKNYTRREFNYQSFTRSFTMPSDIVDVEHIEAKYDNGILKLAVPKRENAKKEVKTIEIK
jgi:HSP20 family molecular chaperone IbpA